MSTPTLSEQIADAEAAYERAFEAPAPEVAAPVPFDLTPTTGATR